MEFLSPKQKENKDKNGKEEVEKGEREIRLTKGIENKAILIIN